MHVEVCSSKVVALILPTAVARGDYWKREQLVSTSVTKPLSRRYLALVGSLTFAR